MKHLKEYKVFETLNYKRLTTSLGRELHDREKEIIDYIEDICQDLIDEGFSVSLYGWDFGGNTNVVITKPVYEERQCDYSYSEVSGTVERLKSYLGEMFVCAHVLNRFDWVSTDKVLDEIEISATMITIDI